MRIPPICPAQRVSAIFGAIQPFVVSFADILTISFADKSFLSVKRSLLPFFFLLTLSQKKFIPLKFLQIPCVFFSVSFATSHPFLFLK